MHITVDSNAEEVANVMAKFKTTVTWRAMNRAVKRTLQGTKAHASQEIRKAKIARLSAQEIKAGVRTSMRAGVTSQLGGTVYISERPVSVTRFYARTVRVGHRIGVQAKTLQGRTYRVGFPLEHSGGRLRRTTRVTEKTIVLKRKGDKRFPLQKVYGASIADIVRHTTLENNIRRYAGERLAREVEQNLAHYLKREGKV